MSETDDLYRALERRYQPPAWALLTNVANGTGGGASGWADAIAMSLWPSRGVRLWGFELKAFRGDWLRELKKPKKAEQFVKYCDHWVIVTPRDIVKKDELPPTWGLLELHGQKLIMQVEPPKLEPEPFHRLQLASLLRRVEQSERERASRARTEGVEHGRTLGPEEFETERARFRNTIKSLEHKIETFEKASGISLDAWRLGDIGEVVKQLVDLRGHPLPVSVHLGHVRDNCKRVLRALDDEIAYLDGVAEAAKSLREDQQG